MGSKWHFSCEARTPDEAGGSWSVGVLERKVKRLLEAKHQVKLCRLALVKDVVLDPVMIIQGWDRPEYDGCFVYVGKPSRDLRGVTIETPPPSGMWFVVFVFPDGTIDDWNWRPDSQDGSGLPEDVKGEIVWRRT